MAKQEGPTTGQRDWVTLLLALSVLYLVILLPFVALIGGKPEVVGAAIGVLTTTLGGIVAVRAVRK